MKANYKNQEKKVSGDLNISLYDLNKASIPQLPDYTEVEFAAAVDLINSFVGTNKFYMLLGREVNYYTVFMREPTMEETIGEAVVDCLKCFSASHVKSIEMAEGAIEAWVMNGEEATVMYFFPYNEGVIICR